MYTHFVNVFLLLFQIPFLGMELKMLPMYFSIFGAILQLKSAFQVIFMEGGVGKNGATVAVSKSILLRNKSTLFYFIF